MADGRASLSRDDLQGLYDHLGTIPYAPGSWSHNLRAALSEALATADDGYEGPLRVKKATAERVVFHIPGCQAFVDGECDKDCVTLWWERQRGTHGAAE